MNESKKPKHLRLIQFLLLISCIISFGLVFYYSLDLVSLITEIPDDINSTTLILARIYAGFLSWSAIGFFAQFIRWVLVRIGRLDMEEDDKWDKAIKTVRNVGVWGTAGSFALLELISGSIFGG